MDILFIILILVYLITLVAVFFTIVDQERPFDITFWAMLMYFCPIVNTIMVFVLNRHKIRKFFSVGDFIDELKTKL